MGSRQIDGANSGSGPLIQPRRVTQTLTLTLSLRERKEVREEAKKGSQSAPLFFAVDLGYL